MSHHVIRDQNAALSYKAVLFRNTMKPKMKAIEVDDESIEVNCHWVGMDFGTQSRPKCGICEKSLKPPQGLWKDEETVLEDVLCGSCHSKFEYDEGKDAYVNKMDVARRKFYSLLHPHCQKVLEQSSNSTFRKYFLDTAYNHVCFGVGRAILGEAQLVPRLTKIHQRIKPNTIEIHKKRGKFEVYDDESWQFLKRHVSNRWFSLKVVLCDRPTPTIRITRLYPSGVREVKRRKLCET